jgi:hypothetical protein
MKELKEIEKDEGRSSAEITEKKDKERQLVLWGMFFFVFSFWHCLWSDCFDWLCKSPTVGLFGWMRSLLFFSVCVCVSHACTLFPHSPGWFSMYVYMLVLSALFLIFFLLLSHTQSSSLSLSHTHIHTQSLSLSPSLSPFTPSQPKRKPPRRRAYA